MCLYIRNDLKAIKSMHPLTHTTFMKTQTSNQLNIFLVLSLCWFHQNLCRQTWELNTKILDLAWFKVVHWICRCCCRNRLDWISLWQEFHSCQPLSLSITFNLTKEKYYYCYYYYYYYFFGLLNKWRFKMPNFGNNSVVW